MSRDPYSLWLIEFRRADTRPPSENGTYLVSDGKKVSILEFRDGSWLDREETSITNLVGWAELPDAAECIEELRTTLAPDDFPA